MSGLRRCVVLTEAEKKAAEKLKEVLREDVKKGVEIMILIGRAKSVEECAKLYSFGMALICDLFIKGKIILRKEDKE